MKLLMYSLFLLLAAPCNKKATETAATKTDNSKAVITYQTTPCFGRCPLYTLTISGETKTATFVGTQNTERIGTYTKALTSKELDEFVNAFEAIGFWSLNDEYLGNITDFPIKYITYSNNGKTKKIKTRSEVPEDIKKLEKILAAYANDEEGWKKTEDSSNSKD